MPQVIVQWSDKAKRPYNDIIEYLISNWTEKEINYFIFRTDSIIDKIISNSQLFKQYKNNPLIRQAVVHETVILIYQIAEDGGTINLFTFWGTRQNPKKLKLRGR